MIATIVDRFLLAKMAVNPMAGHPAITFLMLIHQTIVLFMVVPVVELNLVKINPFKKLLTILFQPLPIVSS